MSDLPHTIRQWHSPSFFACIALLVVQASQGLFLNDPPEFADETYYFVWLTFGLVMLGATCKAIRVHQGGALLRFRFVILDAFIAAIAICSPMFQGSVIINFELNRFQRMKVVELIEAGKLVQARGADGHTFALPNSLRYLSENGQVQVHYRNDVTEKKGLGTLTVFFNIVRLVPGRRCEFEYIANDEPPSSSDVLEVKKMCKNWYWVAN